MYRNQRLLQKVLEFAGSENIDRFVISDRKTEIDKARNNAVTCDAVVMSSECAALLHAHNDAPASNWTDCTEFDNRDAWAEYYNAVLDGTPETEDVTFVVYEPS